MGKLVDIDGLNRQTSLMKDWVKNASGKLNAPVDSSDGNGKFLKSNGNGTTSWASAAEIPQADLADAVDNYFTEHPGEKIGLDTGDVEWEHLDAAVQNKITSAHTNVAAIEASSTASVKHEKGSHFEYNNTLYEATTTIIAGETITPGTNCKAVVISDELSNLKSAINNIVEPVVTPYIEELTDLVWESGYVTNGVTYPSEDYMHTTIPVEPGDVIKGLTNGNPQTWRFCDQMNGTTVVDPQSQQAEITVLNGVSSIVATMVTAYQSLPTFIVTRSRMTTVYNLIMDDGPTENSDNPAKSGGIYFAISEVNSKVDNLAEITTEEETSTSTIDVDTTINDGFLAADGSIYTTGYETSGYTDKIPVQTGDVFRAYKMPQNEEILPSIRVLCAYNGDTLVSGANSTPMPYTVPSGVDNIAVSLNANYKNARFTITRPITQLHPALYEKVQEIESLVANPCPNRLIFDFDLSANSAYSDPQQRSLEDACGYRIAFFGKISGALQGQVIIGKGYGTHNGAAIGIDADKVYLYLNGATVSSPTYSGEHGLTLKDYINVIIDCGYVAGNAVKVYIKTNGAEYTYTPSFWRSQAGYLSVTSTADALTDCELSYAVPALDNDIWMYGDSYFGFWENNRWPYWLVSEGHTKYLLNAFPGRNSPAAYESFLIDLSLKRLPKKIVWCMGMNDKDGDNAPNANWQASVENLASFCEKNSVELILATIPNVPSSTTKNTQKNAYVKASGYRYIDFANAVSPDGGNVWYDGMLNSDNVHPNKEGAKALFAAAVTCVPELLK